jgi:hypothetical protein
LAQSIEEDGWKFNIWMEMTQHLNDIPKETKSKAQSFLLKDTSGTNKKSPQEGVQALLTWMINPNHKTWQVKFAITLKQKYPHTIATVKYLKQMKKPIKFAICQEITALTGLKNALQKQEGLLNQK